jgi:hypothetical protein
VTGEQRRGAFDKARALFLEVVERWPKGALADESLHAACQAALNANFTVNGFPAAARQPLTPAFCDGTGAARRVTTGTAAQFDLPFGITRIGTNFYTVDFNTQTVRQITAGGVVSTSRSVARVGSLAVP